MRQAIKLIILFSLFSHKLLSQNVHIIDYITGKAITNVFIYHEKKEDLAYSNEKGVADISNFPNGLIFFQHPSYHEKSVAFSGNDLKILMKEKIITHHEVVVAVNKWSQKTANVSQKYIKVDKKTIHFENPQTAADLLGNTGEVFIQKSQLGGGSPKIRGFSANSVLLVVDGVRMNNAIFRSGNLQNIINIDVNAVESSEVVFGPGSVIYGSDALGGVMNFHTIQPKWAIDAKPKITTNALLRYSSAAHERTGHIDFSLSQKKFTFFHSSSFTAFDDLKAGSNRSGGYQGEFERSFYVARIAGEDQLIKNENSDVQKFSGYHLFNTISKAKYQISPYVAVSYGFYFSTTSDIPRYDNLTETIPNSDSLDNAAWYYGPQKWQLHNLQLSFYKINTLFNQAKITLAYQKFDESRNDRGFGNDQLRVRTEHVDMYSIAIDFDKEFTHSNLYYGVDFYHNDITSEAFKKNIVTEEITKTSSRYPDGGSDYTSFAFYGNYVHNLTHQISFNGGLRFNTIQLTGETTADQALANNIAKIDVKNTAVNGSMGLVINPNSKNKISFNLSSGFRAPNVDDIGKIFDVGSSIIVPNPDLKPEHSLSYELSYQRKTDQSIFKIVAFRSHLFDAIIDGEFMLNGRNTLLIDNEVFDIFSKINAGKAELYGASLSYTTEFLTNWVFTKKISYTGGRDITNNQPLRHTTPLFGKTTITYKKNKLKFFFSIDYNSSRNRDEIPDAEILRKSYLYTKLGSPGWYTLNFKSSIQLNKYVNLNVGVENILDKHYRPYSSGISAPGRNFIISLRANI